VERADRAEAFAGSLADVQAYTYVVILCIPYSHSIALTARRTRSTSHWLPFEAAPLRFSSSYAVADTEILKGGGSGRLYQPRRHLSQT